MISSWPGQGDGEWWWLKRNWDKRERKDFDRDSCWWTTEGDWSHHSSGVALHIPRNIAYSSQYCIFVAILHIPRNIAYSLHNLRDETYPISVLFGGSFSGNSCPFSSKWVEFQISFNTFNDRILVVLKQPSAFFKIINFELFEDEVWRRFNFWRLCQRVWYEVYLWINSLDIFWTCMSLSKGLVRVLSLDKFFEYILNFYVFVKGLGTGSIFGNALSSKFSAVFGGNRDCRGRPHGDYFFGCQVIFVIIVSIIIITI